MSASSPSSAMSQVAKDKHASIADYRGLAYRSPLLGGVLAFFLISLIGIPFTGGFFGKFYVFRRRPALGPHLAGDPWPLQQRRSGLLLPAPADLGLHKTERDAASGIAREHQTAAPDCTAADGGSHVDSRDCARTSFWASRKLGPRPSTQRLPPQPQSPPPPRRMNRQMPQRALRWRQRSGRSPGCQSPASKARTSARN